MLGSARHAFRRATTGQARARGKVLVVVAAQQAAKGIGRIRLTRVASASAKNLEEAIAAAIEIGSQVRTDDWKGHSLASPHAILRPDEVRLVLEPPRLHRFERLRQHRRGRP